VHCILGDFGYWAVIQVTVWQSKGFKIARSRGNAPTANFPFRNQLLAEFRVMVELLGHLLGTKADRSFVILALDEQSECLVRSGDDGFAIFFMGLGVSEALLLFFRVGRIGVVYLLPRCFDGGTR
jgi:hypothetical protein